MTIADLLTRSRDAHRQAQAALRRHDAAGAQSLFAGALDLRQQAHAADPKHEDLAWLIDVQSSMGHEKRDRRVSLVEIARQQHDLLMAYYQEQSEGLTTIDRQVDLGPDLGKQTLRLVRPVKTAAQPQMLMRDIRAAVAVPVGKDGQPTMAVEDSAAFKQLMKEQGRETP